MARRGRRLSSDRRHARRGRREAAAVGAALASVAVAGVAPAAAHTLAGADRERPMIDDAAHLTLRPMPGAAAARATDSAADQTVDARPRRFDIPAGPLDAALKTFAATSGLTVDVSDDLTHSINTAGVSAILTNEQALRALLTGTGFSFRYTSATAVTVEIRTQGESVDVLATAAPQQVSSAKYTAPLRDIPQTIEVIPSALMQQQAVRTLSDALRNVPGISLQAGEGGGASSTTGDMFNMRGFSANNSLFVDGVRDDGLVSRDVFNLEQVEVFLGPTGSDVGRGTAAGYVNMDTKTPHPGSAYATSFAYGAADEKRLTLDVNHGLSSRHTGDWRDGAAVRLNALWDEGGVPGRDIAHNKNQAIAPSVAFGLGSPTRVSLAALVERQDNTPDYGIPAAAWQGSLLAPTVVQALQPVKSTNFYGSPDYDFDKVQEENYTARVEHDLGKRLVVRNQTRYNHTHRTAVISAMQNPAAFAPATQTLTIARQGSERENKILSNQTSLNAQFETGRFKHAASAGLELTTEQQLTPTLTGLGTRAAAVDIYDPNPLDPITGYAPARSGAFSRGRTVTEALYAFDAIDVGRHWQVSGGARLEHYDTSFLTVDATNVATLDQKANDNLLSGKAALMYRVNDAANVYLSYGTSATPPGTANFTLSAQANNQNNPDVKPQQSTNLELGAKWDLFDHRLTMNAATFHTKNTNVIYTSDPTAVPPVYNQDDGQRVNGATVGATGHITRRWDIVASVGYLSTAQESQNPANDGKQLTLTPPWSGSLWTTFRAMEHLTIGGGVRFTDPVFVNTANTIQTPGYHLVDGLVQYDVNSHLSLRLNVTNVTDAVYIKNVNNNGGRYNPGAPRAALLTSTVGF